jgi:flagellar hook-associated protein 2
MSITGTSSFSFDGVLSGMNTSSIIDALVAAQRAPLTQLENQRAKIETRDAAYQDVRGKLSSFQSSLKTLLLTSSINTRSTVSSTPTIATASASADAASGTFSVNVLKRATATVVNSGAAIGRPVTSDGFGNVDSSVVLASAGLATPISSGNFTINGQTIAVNPAVDTWADVKTRIETATASTVTLAFGPNSVSLVSNGAPMQIGSGSDTSNFLTATHLAGAAQVGSGGVPPTTYTVASNAKLGAANTTAALSNANLVTAIDDNGGTGSFKVNGVDITWTANDSLNSVLTRINASTANVRASYDPSSDKISLVSLNTGAQDVALSDTSGNFLAAVGLGAGSMKTVGAPAEYTITQNGTTSPTQYSNTNSVSNALPGVSLTLAGEGSTTVSISQDTGAAAKNVQAFVDAYNSLTDQIDKYTFNDIANKRTGVLSGDSTIRGIQNQIRGLIGGNALVGSGATYKSLADIGISTGKVGSAVGTTKHLTLDTTKLTEALNTNASAVFSVLSGFSATTSVTPDASNPWLQRVDGTATGKLKSGTFQVTYDPTGNALSSVFTEAGGTAQAAVTGTLIPGEANTALIPGLSLKPLASLPAAAGTDTINYTVTSRGVLQTLDAYLTSTLGASGAFATEQTGATDAERAIDKQIDSLNARLDKRRLDLQRQFTAMEIALGKLQQQSASLFSKLGSNNDD